MDQETPLQWNWMLGLPLTAKEVGVASETHGSLTNLQQITHWCIIAQTKLCSFTIQNLLLISVKVFIHHCVVRICECCLYRGIKGWFRGNRKGYFVGYRISAWLVCHHWQCCRPFSSRNRLSWDFSKSNNFLDSIFLWESLIHLHSTSDSSSAAALTDSLALEHLHSSHDIRGDSY